MSDMNSTIDWEQLPFFSKKKILQYLPYPEILRIIKTIPNLRNTYNQINSYPGSKFVFDHNIDSPRLLITCINLTQIYLNIRVIPLFEAVSILILLNLREKIELLFIKDRNVLSQDIMQNVFQTRFHNLTIESTNNSQFSHSISPLLRQCSSLREFTYSHGKLFTKDMK